MLEKIIDTIFEVKYGSIITPRNLLENSKLANYSYVKYEKSTNFGGLTVELECSCADEIVRIFKYYFDTNDKLMRIVVCEPLYEVIFDREKEMEKLLSEYQNKLSSQTALEAI